MPSNQRTPASNIALGGILAALAVIIMSMGTLIPATAYTCVMLCMLILQLVLRTCGSRIAWAWYGAVAILSLLMAADKEAAAIFLALGYYPIVKPKLDCRKGKWFWKALFFNFTILTVYWLMMHILGFEELAAEFSETSQFMTVVLLLMGNVLFLLVDKVLEKKKFRRRMRGGR